jgi:hypothetical protein
MVDASNFLSAYGGSPTGYMTPQQAQFMMQYGQGLQKPSQPGQSGPFQAYNGYNAAADAFRGALGGYIQGKAMSQSQAPEAILARNAMPGGQQGGAQQPMPDGQQGGAQQPTPVGQQAPLQVAAPTAQQAPPASSGSGGPPGMPGMPGGGSSPPPQQTQTTTQWGQPQSYAGQDRMVATDQPGQPGQQQQQGQPQQGQNAMQSVQLDGNTYRTDGSNWYGPQAGNYNWYSGGGGQ